MFVINVTESTLGWLTQTRRGWNGNRAVGKGEKRRGPSCSQSVGLLAVTSVRHNQLVRAITLFVISQRERQGMPLLAWHIHPTSPRTRHIDR